MPTDLEHLKSFSSFLDKEFNISVNLTYVAPFFKCSVVGANPDFYLLIGYFYTEKESYLQAIKWVLNNKV